MTPPPVVWPCCSSPDPMIAYESKHIDHRSDPHEITAAVAVDGQVVPVGSVRAEGSSTYRGLDAVGHPRLVYYAGLVHAELEPRRLALQNAHRERTGHTAALARVWLYLPGEVCLRATPTVVAPLYSATNVQVVWAGARQHGLPGGLPVPLLGPAATDAEQQASDVETLQRVLDHYNTHHPERITL